MNNQDQLLEDLTLDKPDDEQQNKSLVAATGELKLAEDTRNIVQDIIKEDNVDNLKDLTKLFNIMIAKKNAVRMMQLNELLDAVNEEALSRVINTPELIKDKDLSVYMAQALNQMEKATKTFEALDDTPAIQLNQQTNNVNINLSSDSKERILEVIKLLTQQQEVEDNNSQEVIDTSYSELFDEEDNEEN